MNELAALCEKVGGDIEEVRRGMSTDVRIGRHFLYAGAGYGGSCFPKDVQALMATGKKEGVPLGIVTAAEVANAKQKVHLVSHIKKHFSDRLEGKVFSIWGLAFKPNTDDMREAPAIRIIEELTKAGAKVRVFDPVSMENAKKVLPDHGVTFCKSNYEAVEGTDGLVVVTEWNEFRHPDFDKLKKLLKTPVIFDGRNLYNPESVHENGFAYYGIGRGKYNNKNRT